MSIILSIYDFVLIVREYYKEENLKILITGACGYIGSHACVEFLNNEYNIIGIDNFCNCLHNVKDNIQEITNKKFDVYNCDIRNLNDLEQIFRNNDINAVIHFAGLKSIRESYLYPLEYYENNVVGSLNILKLMKKYNVKNLIFSSSASVYGFDKTPPFKESDHVEIPIHPYGKTKFIIEQMILDMKNINCAILRYFNPVGSHHSYLIGENPKGIPNNLMPIIVSVCSGKLPKLTVFGHDYDTPDGTCVRDYIHVVDLAKGHLKALSYLLNNKGQHIFNLGTGKGTSVLELLNIFEHVNNIKIKYEIGERRDGDLPVCFSSCEKAYKKLGWKASLTVEDMCKSAWNWALNMNKN